MTNEMLTPAERFRERFRISSKLKRNALSELVGTALLLFIGLGIVMQFILSEEKLNTWIQINIGWGLAIAFTVYMCSNTSGGHFNPAVSLAMVTLGKLSLSHFLVYFVVQTVGAFIGAAAAYGLYYDQFQHFSGNQRIIVGNRGTAGCFSSYPAPYVSNLTSFFDQVAGTGLLTLFVAAIIDKRNKIPAAAHPLLFGLVVTMIGTAYGMNLGYPINPARDLGPRLFSWFIYGSGVFTVHSYYSWIPVIAPLFGGPLGVWLYTITVGAHIPDTVAIAEDEAKQPLKDGVDA